MNYDFLGVVVFGFVLLIGFAVIITFLVLGIFLIKALNRYIKSKDVRKVCHQEIAWQGFETTS